jgi:hypothetical protein
MSFVPDQEEIDAAVARGDVQWLLSALETTEGERQGLMHELGRLRHDPKAKAAELPPLLVRYCHADESVTEHRIIPDHAWYGIVGGNQPEWEGECQWALYAWDVDRQEYDHFVLKRLMTDEKGTTG